MHAEVSEAQGKGVGAEKNEIKHAGLSDLH